jgi:hypothetical protein
MLFYFILSASIECMKLLFFCSFVSDILGYSLNNKALIKSS